MNLLEVPEQGMMYAIYTNEVKYEKYNRSDLDEKEILRENLLELHLFDEEVEYRYIKMRERQKEEAKFIIISDETVPHEKSYPEKIYTLKPGQEKPDKNSGFVEVISYITYDENDLMRIDNYRLKEVK